MNSQIASFVCLARVRRYAFIIECEAVFTDSCTDRFLARRRCVVGTFSIQNFLRLVLFSGFFRVSLADVIY